MGQPKERSSSVRHYFVDEAGDGTLFNRRGRIIVGTGGCSRFFILGLLDVSDPESLAREMEELRAHLLADPYFKGVPSMQPEAKKNACTSVARTGTWSCFGQRSGWCTTWMTPVKPGMGSITHKKSR